MTNLDTRERRAWNFPPRLSFFVGFMVVALAFIFAAFISWRRWPDLIVDFGGQLYIPWRISNGAVLYRDLFYFAGGPLSQYFNALLFKVFGTSFLTLIVANLILVSATLLLIYNRFVAAADVLTATTVCLGIVLIFVFGQYSTIGNYNYIAPYSHEILHGLLLSILAIALLSDWLAQEKIRYAAAAGFCAGLVFLTKPDVFVALSAACVVALVVFYFTRRRDIFVTKSLIAFLFAATIPSFAFFLYFLRVENWHDSLRSVVFGWLPLFQTSIAQNPFYQWCLGFDQPTIHLSEIVVYFIFIVGAITLYAFAFRLVQKLKSNLLKWLLFILLICPLLFLAVHFNWLSCGYSLPLMTFTTCVLLRENYGKLPIGRLAGFPLLWSVFGLMLLLKLGFFPRIWHYGFALAMPAFVSVVYLLLWLLPLLLEKRLQISALFFRIAVLSVLLIGFGNLFLQSEKFYAAKNLAVGQAGDRIIVSGPSGNSVEARTANSTLAWIDANVPTNATIAALPQGVLMNYLSRRVNSTPCLDWNPTMLTVIGEEKMTEAFEKNPPDFILIVEWKSYEFGFGYFGQQPGYGVKLMDWISNNYTRVQLFGSEPLKKGLFGMELMKRNPLVPQKKIESPMPPD